jgi:hypothetical protein
VSDIYLHFFLPGIPSLIIARHMKGGLYMTLTVIFIRAPCSLPEQIMQQSHFWQDI